MLFSKMKLLKASIFALSKSNQKEKLNDDNSSDK
jgi:hypothetical protein